MNNSDDGFTFYRRNLPHYQIPGAEYFITFRLIGSLPQALLKEFKETNDGELPDSMIERKKQEFIQGILDKGGYGPTWLKRPEIASIIMDSLFYRDGDIYELYGFCIMPNHVHLIFRHIGQEKNGGNTVPEILHSLKLYTARKANKILGRTGQFWQHESYDHIIRDNDELHDILVYTLYNPVEAGLVERWED